MTVATDTQAGSSALGDLFQESSLVAEGFTIRYWEAGDGPTLVYLHPAGGPWQRAPLDRLTERFRVVQFEMPGWGDRPNDSVGSLADLASQMAAIIAAAGIDRYHLMGTSLGGAVALHLAVQFPDRVTSLVLEAPAAFREGATPPDQLAAEDVLRAFRTHPERLPPFQMPPADAMARFWPLVTRLMAGPPVDDDLIAAMQGCAVRTLVLFGTDDGIIPPANGRTYRRHLNNSSLVYVHDAAHDIMGDRPEAFTEVAGDFLERGMAFLVPQEDTLLNP
jgi:pimeloyl-ACP methyl ester carboxylesterase